ncbi:hypothetical protein GGX14DRAFT_459984, partial [Mycena pura]
MACLSWRSYGGRSRDARPAARGPCECTRTVGREKFEDEDEDENEDEDEDEDREGTRASRRDARARSAPIPRMGLAGRAGDVHLDGRQVRAQAYRRLRGQRARDRDPEFLNSWTRTLGIARADDACAVGPEQREWSSAGEPLARAIRVLAAGSLRPRVIAVGSESAARSQLHGQHRSARSSQHKNPAKKTWDLAPSTPALSAEV